MPLIDIPLRPRERRLPRDVAEFLEEADHRIRTFIKESEIAISGFVPSDFEPVFHALDAVVEQDLAAGDVFCEWGSGFGVVAMLASLMEFQCYGIEIEDGLVAGSRLLADDFDLPVDFVTGSFIPVGGEPIVEQLCSGPDVWLSPVSDDAYQTLGMEPRDFDLIYAFPWPGEEGVIAALFDEFASMGALLLTFDHIEGVRVRRKVARNKTSR